MKSFKITLLFLLISLLLSSCENDNPEPEKSFNEKIIGRWEITEDISSLFSVMRFSASSQSQKLLFTKNQRISQLEKMSIEFFENGIAILLMKNGPSFLGKYNTSNKHSVTIEIINGSVYIPESVLILNNLELTETKLTGLMRLSGQEASFSASKTTAIALDKKTQLLCREWKLDIPYIKEQFSELPIEIRPKDDDVPDKAIYLFSQYGSLFGTVYFNSNIDYDFTEWAWKDDKTIILNPTSPYPQTADIITLNENELIIKQLMDEKYDEDTNSIKRYYANTRFTTVK